LLALVLADLVEMGYDAGTSCGKQKLTNGGEGPLTDIFATIAQSDLVVAYQKLTALGVKIIQIIGAIAGFVAVVLVVLSADLFCGAPTLQATACPTCMASPTPTVTYDSPTNSCWCCPYPPQQESDLATLGQLC
jgi:hypothetical protein